MNTDSLVTGGTEAIGDLGFTVGHQLELFPNPTVSVGREGPPGIR